MARAWRVVMLAVAVVFAQAASAQLLVNKSFSPVNIPPAGISTLTIEILNNTATAATAVALTDVFPASPAGMVIAAGGLISNSCGGIVTATPGTATVSLSGGAVAASVAGVAGQCTIKVAVTATPASPPTSYPNAIPPANVSSSIGSSSTTASATLSITGVNGITGTKAFTPTNVHGNGPATRMRIQLNNSNAFALTNVAFTDTFPTTMQLASVPNVSNSCGGTVTATSLGLSLSLSGGTIPASGNCVILADIIARNPNTAPQDSSNSNSIAINGVTSAQGARNAAAISGSLRVQKAALVTKVFAPTGIQAGGTSALTITLTNFNATAITGFSFTDAMPTGLTVVGPTATTCSGGSASATATSVSVTGATLAAAPTGIGQTSCTITTTVTAASNGNYVNSVPAGSLAGISYAAASGTLLVSSVTGTKAFSPTSVPRSGISMLTITLQNRSTISPATITSFTDNLTTMGAGLTIATTPAATTTCGGTLSATPTGTLITLSGGTIPRAATAATPGACTITVPVQVGVSVATGTRTNSIAVNGLQTSQGNNAAAITASLSVANPITVAKAFAPTNVVASTVTRLTVTITRPAYAGLFTGLTVTDPLPAGFTVAPTPSATTTCTGGSVSATPGASSVTLSGASLGTSLAASASCNFQVNVRAPATTGASTNTIPVGNATATTPAGTVSNTSAASAVVTVVNGVTVNKSFAPTTVTPGATSRLTIYVNNPSSIATALTGVTLTDTLPTGLIIDTPANASFTATSGTCSGTLSAVPGAGTVGISGANLSSGASCELGVDVTTSAIGTLNNVINTGTMTSVQGQTNVNTATATLVSSGNADVAVSKSDPVATMIAGTSTTYGISITNNSSALTVAGLPVTDTQPADMSFTSWTCTATPGSSCATSSGSGDIADEVTLAPLGTATLTVVGALSPDSLATSVANTVTVDPAAAGVFDPVSGNNSAVDTNAVTRSADVRVTKAISNPNPPVGSSVTFTVTAINDGPSTARDVEVTDALQSGYTLDTATPSIGTFTAPLWDIGNLAPAAPQTLTISADVNAAGDYSNSASITTSTNDPMLSNNTASITPTTVGLRLDKTSAILSDPVNGTLNPKAIPGAEIEYRIRVWNEGSAAIDLDAIVIEDVLPDVDVFVSTSGGPPVQFIDGSPASGLTYSYASDLGWTSQAGGGAPYSFSPGAGPWSSAVTGLRINPKGVMAAGSTASAPSFEIVYRVRIR